MPSQDSKTCSVIRLTEREDMTADDGYRFAQSAVNNSNKYNLIFIWSAIACTGGSPWPNINKLFPGGEERLKGHLKIFKALWKKLVMFVDWVHYNGRRWRICVGWREKFSTISYQQVYVSPRLLSNKWVILRLKRFDDRASIELESAGMLLLSAACGTHKELDPWEITELC